MRFGKMNINTLEEGAADLSGITTTGTTILTSDANLTLGGKLPGTAFTLNGNKALTLSSDSIADGRLLTISESKITADAANTR